MKYFIASDVHSFFDEYMFSLKEQGFDMFSQEHKVILLGDNFDRGPKPREMENFIMKLLEKDKAILTLGNHEELALDLINNYHKYVFKTDTHHHLNGTFQTLCALGEMDVGSARDILPYFKMKAKSTHYIKDIIPSMVDYYETDKYVFTHAWIPLSDKNKYDPNWRVASKERWERARWIKPLDAYSRKLYPNDKCIVCGHQSCSAFWEKENPNKYALSGKRARFDPYIIKKHVIALDGHTVESGVVNVLVLEDN